MTARNYAELHGVTVGMTVPERIAYFMSLSEDERAEIVRGTARIVWQDGRRQWARERLGGCYSLAELDVEVAKIAAAEGEVDQPRLTHRRVDRSEFSGDLLVLRSIPSATFVPALTGRELTGGFTSCPFHASGAERTASLHLEPDAPAWHCFGCQRGGGLVEFFAELRGIPVPSGREFKEFIQELATALRGAAC